MIVHVGDCCHCRNDALLRCADASDVVRWCHGCRYSVQISRYVAVEVVQIVLCGRLFLVVAGYVVCVCVVYGIAGTERQE